MAHSHRDHLVYFFEGLLNSGGKFTWDNIIFTSTILIRYSLSTITFFISCYFVVLEMSIKKLFHFFRYLDHRFGLYQGSELVNVPMSVAFSFSLANEGLNLIRRHLTRPDEEQYAGFLQEIAVSPAVVSKRCIVSELTAVHRGTFVEQWLERQTTLKVIPWSFSSPDFTAATEFITGLVISAFSLILQPVYKMFHVFVFNFLSCVKQWNNHGRHPRCGSPLYKPFKKISRP